MTRTRVGYLACVVAWLVLHVTLAALYRTDAAFPGLFAASVVAYFVVVAFGAAPLLRPGTLMSSHAAWFIALAACVVELANVLSLRAGAIAGYSNFAIGGLSVLMPALVFRGRAGLASATAGALVAIQWVTGVLNSGPDGFHAVSFLWLSVPPPLWLAASIAVQRAMRRGELLVAVFEQRASEFNSSGVFDALNRERARRASEFEADVVPLLQQIRDGVGFDQSLRDQAREVSVSLRDQLVARTLLVPEVRDAVSQARERGARVLLTGEPIDSLVQQRLRAALPTLLALPALKLLALRVGPGGREALAVLETGQSLDESTIDRLRAMLSSDVVAEFEVDGLVMSLRVASD